jgi:hypothetical protein
MRNRVLSALFCAVLLYIAGCGGGGGGGGVILPSITPWYNATNVPVTTNLAWYEMLGATSYDVYLGTNQTAVENATNVDPEFMGNQASRIYDPPGNLAYDTQYYWRIDKVNGGTTKGAVWTFTTESAPAVAPDKVAGPDPLNGAVNVPVDKVLAWNGAVGAASYDVYFGTDQTAVTNATNVDPEFMGNQDTVTYDPPGNLGFLTTYYWRIDSVNGTGTTGGDVWSFTTASLPPLPQVTHSGTISSDETWDAAHLHVVNGNVYVESAGAATLTIEAGAFVVFNFGCFIHVGYNNPGGLRAVGDAVNRITFTANSPSPTKGFWGGIYFHDLAYDYDSNPATGCIMDYCDVAWGGYPSGWGRGNGAILVEGLTTGPSIQISNCNVTNSSAFGILMGDGGMFATGSSGNTVSDCNSYPVGIDANEAGTLRAGTYTGNTIDAIEIDSYYSVDTTATWANPGVPYVITYSLYVEGASSPVLTIQPGTTLKFDSGCSLLVGYNYTGTLIANGSSGQEITFTANSPSPTKGFWVGVCFDNLSLDYVNPSTGCQMDYCNVEYAGGNSGWGEGDGCILVEGDDPDGPAVKISNCNASNSAAFGILLGWGGSFAAGSTGNVITTCNSYAVGIDAHKAHTLAAGTYTGNTIDMIRIEPWYEVNTTCTWVNPGVPYEISGINSLRVEGAASPTLTLSSGSTLIFNSGYGLDVGYNDTGGLIANNVTFTGKAQTKGYWIGIVFENLLTTGSLTNCTIEYGGYDSGYSGYSGGVDDDGNIIIIDNARGNTTITGCTIRHTTGYGIVSGWATTATDFTAGNTFTDCDDGNQSPPR